MKKGCEWHFWRAARLGLTEKSSRPHVRRTPPKTTAGALKTCCGAGAPRPMDKPANGAPPPPRPPWPRANPQSLSRCTPSPNKIRPPTNDPGRQVKRTAWHWKPVVLPGHRPALMQCSRRRDALEWDGTPQGARDAVGQAVAKAVGGGYCRLQMPLTPALAVRGAAAGHRLGAPESGEGGWPPPAPPPSNASLPPPPPPPPT